MKINILKSVVVVTPTIGNPKLLDAIQSVDNQTYKNVEHLLVIDGASYIHKVDSVIGYKPDYPNIHTMTLPYNVGANNFYGHRVYASIGHLLNSDYVIFLDEDNWFDPDHVESLVAAIEENHQLDFVYSYRKVWLPDKSKSIEDNCESLGKWPVWVSGVEPHYHMDTSSYLFKRNFLETYGHIWHHGWGADRRFFQYVTSLDNVKSDSTFKHTLNYRLDGNANSVDLKFFQEGNEFMTNRYNGVLPWKNL